MLNLNPITLTTYDIRKLWSFGIITDLAYITFALLSESPIKNLNIDGFIDRWEILKENLTEEELEIGWKPKRLKKKTVLAAIGSLEDKDIIAPIITVECGELLLLESNGM